MGAVTIQRCFRPFLVALSEASQLQINEVTHRVADLLGLSEAERKFRLASGSATVIRNRCGWARTALNRAGLISQVSRGIWRITDEGRNALTRFPVEISEADLRKHYPSFRQWVDEIADRARAQRAGQVMDEVDVPAGAEAADEGFANIPEEMQALERRSRALVEDALLELLQALHWERFEVLVERLVVRLGYGSSETEVRAALSIGAGDSGIDGVIHEDRLGLGQIYLQAKKWQATVGRPELQKFVGAMHGRAKKGVFLTTSDFSSEATQYAKSLHDIRLRLVNGRELASLMIDCGLGVSEEQVYKTYRIDSDFFEESD